MTAQKPNQKEIEEARERIRKIALKNLKAENLMGLAGAFLVEESGQYGEAGGSAVEKFKYFPSFNSSLKNYNLKTGEEVNLFRDAVLNSRQGNKRYSGNISEYGIMQSCANIMQESLDHIKIQDLYSLMKGDKKIREDLKDAYLGDLRPKIPQEEFDKLSHDKKEALEQNMELYKVLAGSYQKYLTDKSVSESLGENAKSTVKGLEKILVEQERR